MFICTVQLYIVLENVDKSLATVLKSTSIYKFLEFCRHFYVQQYLPPCALNMHPRDEHVSDSELLYCEVVTTEIMLVMNMCQIQSCSIVKWSP